MAGDMLERSTISQILRYYVQHAQKHDFNFMQDWQWIHYIDRVSLSVIAGLWTA